MVKISLQVGIFVICRYLEAACLYENGDPNDMERIAEMMREVPKLAKKVAGKSIPYVLLNLTEGLKNSFVAKLANSSYKIRDFCFRYWKLNISLMEYK